jgi:HEPN domain-containing protein
MSALENKAEAGRWLLYARQDLRAAEAIIKQQTGAPRHACWLAQQAAEKAIKAALVYHGTDFPKSHDLDALRHMLPDDWRRKPDWPDLASLTEWAVEARYPGDWPDATPAEAADAVAQATAVLQLVTDEMDRHGFQV